LPEAIDTHADAPRIEHEKLADFRAGEPPAAALRNGAVMAIAAVRTKAAQLSRRAILVGGCRAAARGD
jgi:hypothetical protein